MTLMTDPATAIPTTGAIAPMRSGHPSLGRAPEATIVPLGLDRYEILLDGAVQGFVCATEDGWECFVGTDLERSLPLGERTSITVAIRDLCRAAERAAAAV